MIGIDACKSLKTRNVMSTWAMWGSALMIAVVCLSACSNQEKKAGQSLVRVNGEDITVLQLNDELKHSGVQAGQEEAAKKQLLESLIDRQLILSEAINNKLDRTPEVMQAIERAKAQIITQAYLQNVTSRIAKPTQAEINEYFQSHPEFFTKRKEFDLEQLVFDSKDFSDELKSFINSAKSLDEVAAWMDKHDVQYARGKTVRTTADLPPEIAARLSGIPKGQLFLAEEKGRKMLNVLTDVKDSPISALNAEPMIEQFLTNKKNKDAIDVEIAHLRSLAKIDYPGASAPAAAPAQKTEGAATVK